MSDANTKLKAELKRTNDELVEVKNSLEKLKNENSKNSENQTLVVLL